MSKKEENDKTEESGDTSEDSDVGNDSAGLGVDGVTDMDRTMFVWFVVGDEEDGGGADEEAGERGVEGSGLELIMFFRGQEH